MLSIHSVGSKAGLTDVTVGAFPTVVAVALEGVAAIAVIATRKWNTFVAVGPLPEAIRLSNHGDLTHAIWCRPNIHYFCALGRYTKMLSKLFLRDRPQIACIRPLLIADHSPQK